MTILKVKAGDSPDDVYAAVVDWAAEQGLELYPHQDEAILELLGGANVVLATPTGSGKSLVAVAAHAAALARDQVTYYTAPIKALVSEKFFELCATFGTDDVGMLTGDASVNADAPVICCTAEILANIALREGQEADVGLVVMDEFHYYAEPDRGWAWQVPLLELPHAQFVLMSATLGDLSDLAADLTRRTGRETAMVTEAERPVPLTFTWALTPLPDTLEELVTTHQAPAYVVHFTQKDAVEHATSLLQASYLAKPPPALAERLAGVRFAAGFGKTLSKLLKKGIGVHHAGMLPRYRRLVEQLAQAGLLTVICGTDTLGVGINVPIRTVLFTGLAKFDGRRQRILRTREFLQIAGRAGRAGFDTAGYVVVQAPEHVIENERAKAKSEAKNAALSESKLAKKKSKPHLKKPPDGHGRLDRADLRQARRRRPRAAGLADEGRQRDARQRPLPRGGRVPGAAAAAHRQPLRPARAAPARSPRAPAGPVAAPLRDPHPARRAGPVRAPLRAHRRPARGLRAQPGARPLRAGRARRARPGGGDLPAGRRLRDRGGAGAAAAGALGPAARGPR